VADIDVPGQARAVLLRSPHAHARIKCIAREHALRLHTGGNVIAVNMKRVPTDQEGVEIPQPPSASGVPCIRRCHPR
jgi:CO/xanthine dehydrogenase Mo-binding subunit